MPVESIGGSRYIVLIIDNYSVCILHISFRTKVIYYMFQTFKEKCENILDKRIKRIRIDNDTEFTNNQLRELHTKRRY